MGEFNVRPGLSCGGRIALHLPQLIITSNHPINQYSTLGSIVDNELWHEFISFAARIIIDEMLLDDWTIMWQQRPGLSGGYKRSKAER